MSDHGGNNVVHVAGKKRIAIANRVVECTGVKNLSNKSTVG